MQVLIVRTDLKFSGCPVKLFLTSLKIVTGADRMHRTDLTSNEIKTKLRQTSISLKDQGKTTLLHGK